LNNIVKCGTIWFIEMGDIMGMSLKEYLLPEMSIKNETSAYVLNTVTSEISEKVALGICDEDEKEEISIEKITFAVYDPDKQEEKPTVQVYEKRK
jgi:hypothetical protein